MNYDPAFIKPFLFSFYIAPKVALALENSAGIPRILATSSLA